MLRYLIFIVLIFATQSNLYSNDDLDDETLNKATVLLQSMNCVVFRSFAPGNHTCTDTHASDIAKALGGGSAFLAPAHIRLDYPELFGKKNCQKASLRDLKLTTAFCDDNLVLKIFKAMTETIPRIMIEVTTAGKSFKDAILDAMTDPNSVYTIKTLNVGEHHLVFSGVMPLRFKVVRHRDKLCIDVLSLIGYIPVGCKYIAEPYPYSKYGLIENDINQKIEVDENADPNMYKDKFFQECSPLKSCYSEVYQETKNLTVLAGPIVHCVKKAVNKMLFGEKVCRFYGDEPLHANSALQSMQNKMRFAIKLLITIYISFLGVKIALSGQQTSMGSNIIVFVKCVGVLYFTSGIQDNNGSSVNGMTEYVLPMIISGAAELASWTMNISDSGLCNFQASDYSTMGSQMALFDAVDCRMLHYTGLHGFYLDILLGSFGISSIPMYLWVILPALFLGWMPVVILATLFPVMVITIAAHFVNFFASSIIVILILAVLSPIIIPCILFDSTKQYFHSWFQTLISFMLQPMVAATFLVFFFSILDLKMYNKCEFIHVNYQTNHKTYKLFFIDNNESSYRKYDDGMLSCKRSIGYLISPTNSLSKSHEGTSFDKERLRKMVNNNMFTRIKDMVFTKNHIFSRFSLKPQGVLELLYGLLSGCVLLYICNAFVPQIEAFSADMTKGIALRHVDGALGKLIGGAFDMKDQIKDQIKNISSLMDRGKNNSTDSAFVGKRKNISDQYHISDNNQGDQDSYNVIDPNNSEIQNASYVGKASQPSDFSRHNSNNSFQSNYSTASSRNFSQSARQANAIFHHDGYVINEYQRNDQYIVSEPKQNTQGETSINRFRSDNDKKNIIQYDTYKIDSSQNVDLFTKQQNDIKQNNIYSSTENFNKSVVLDKPTSNNFDLLDRNQNSIQESIVINRKIFDDSNSSRQNNNNLNFALSEDSSNNSNTYESHKAQDILQSSISDLNNEVKSNSQNLQDQYFIRSEKKIQNVANDEYMIRSKTKTLNSNDDK